MSKKILKKIPLYLRTLYYLKVIQIFYIILYRLKKRKPPQNKIDYELRDSFQSWQTSIRKNKSYHNQSFKFLNEKITYKKDIWSRGASTYLWHYNINYFDFINCSDNSSYIKDFEKLIDDWILYNKDYNSISWDSYPTSLRIVNWIKYHNETCSLDKSQIDILYLNGIHLFNNLEYNLLGNHLFTNAKALIFYGAFFKSRDSNVIFKKGLELFYYEFKEQILNDGGHYERSASYNAIIVEDILDIYNLLQSLIIDEDSLDEFSIKKSREIVKLIKKNWSSINHWLETMIHLDNNYPSFNDGSISASPKYESLCNYIKKLGLTKKKVNKEPIIKNIYFKDSGFISAKNQKYKLIYNVGSPSPSYQPGHSHSESLSFEVSIPNQRIIVNSGISTYEKNEQRLLERSIKYHNCLSVNDENCTEVWSSFRVARRPKIKKIKIEEMKDSTVFSAEHDGFKRINGIKKYSRKIKTNENSFEIEDFVDGDLTQKIESRVFLHPKCKIEKKNDYYFIILEEKSVARFHSIDSDINIVDSQYNYDFGIKGINQCIVLKHNSELPKKITILFNFLG